MERGTLQMEKLDFSDLIGKPFSDLGRGPDSYDCWGLVREAGNRLGIEIPDYGDIHYWKREEIKGCIGQKAKFDFVETKEPMVGDIVVFKEGGFGELHFGILIDDHNVLHAGPEIGVRKNSINSIFFRQMIKGFYRCKSQ